MIPLQPPQARARSVERLIEHQFTGVDNQPLPRADARRQLLTQAETATDSDRRLMALSLQRVDDIPVPASLVVHWIDVPAGPDRTPSDGALLTSLQDAFGAPAEPGFALEVEKLAAGRVLRRVHEVPAEPTGAGLVQLAFATPMLPLRQPLLELFDAIAGALHWVTG